MNRVLTLMVLLGTMLMAFSAHAEQPTAAADENRPREALIQTISGETPLGMQYRLPQMSGKTDADHSINKYYLLIEKDLREQKVQSADDKEIQQAELSFECKAISDRYVSFVLLTEEISVNGTACASIQGNTFARDGVYAGQTLTLSQVLGMEEENTELGQKVTPLQRTVYQLVWQIVSEEMKNTDGDYLGGLTVDDLEAAFYPETDFFIDQDGNVVFFVQAGELAGEVAGILYFPFSPDELISSVAES